MTIIVYSTSFQFHFGDSVACMLTYELSFYPLLGFTGCNRYTLKRADWKREGFKVLSHTKLERNNKAKKAKPKVPSWQPKKLCVTDVTHNPET